MAVLDCLKGLVGIKGRDSAAQVYVQALPGISVLDFERAINNESRNAYERVDELIQLAIQEVSQDVEVAFKGKFELKSFIENEVVGYFWENQVVVPAVVNNMVGLQIQCVLSPYTKLFIRRLRFMMDYTGTFNIEAWDLIQNKQLKTAVVTAVAGSIVEITPDWEFSTNKQRLDLFIGYASTFSSYKTLITAYKNDQYTAPWLNSWMFVRGVQLENGKPKIWRNLTGNSGGTGGVSFDYSLQCSFDEKLCNIKGLLAMPILYRLGALMLQEMKYSKRLNGLITAHTADNKELMEYYTAQYQQRMQDIFLNMVMPNDVCFNCTPPVITRTALP